MKGDEELGLEKLAQEYRQSAEKLNERISLLKRIDTANDRKTQLVVDDRLLILNAEYSYLVKMADYFDNYYRKGRTDEEAKL